MHTGQGYHNLRQSIATQCLASAKPEINHHKTKMINIFKIIKMIKRIKMIKIIKVVKMTKVIKTIKEIKVLMTH